MKYRGKSKKKVRSLPHFKEYLKENGLRYKDVAEMVGYTENAISNFANRKAGSINLVSMLSRELGVNQALIAEVIEA